MEKRAIINRKNLLAEHSTGGHERHRQAGSRWHGREVLPLKLKTVCSPYHQPPYIQSEGGRATHRVYGKQIQQGRRTRVAQVHVSVPLPNVKFLFVLQNTSRALFFHFCCHSGGRRRPKFIELGPVLPPILPRRKQPKC